jgi:hypothetical protein
MSSLILNSFTVQISPVKLSLPYVEFTDWESSTTARNRDYGPYRTYRYERSLNHDGLAEPVTIRLVLLSGPPVSSENQTDEFDLSSLPKLGAILIENSLSDHLESQGMTIKRNSFERLALRSVDSQSAQLVHLYSGISFQARRPFKAEPYSFILSIQWVASAVFSDTLANQVLRGIARGLAVLYSPKKGPLAELVQFENAFLGHVKDLSSSSHAEVLCRDNVRRAIPLDDLTLEASPEALRRYELATGTEQQRFRVWRRLQQISKVLTPEGRRNTSVLRDRLEAIRGVLGGHSREQLVLSLGAYAEGTVSIGLAPIRVELPL